jgi:hypothetical protein
MCLVVIKRMARNKKAKCIREKHHLTVTTQTEMLATGDKSYTVGWFCDKCLVRYVHSHRRMSTPFFRCNVCKLDYCEICKNIYFDPLSPVFNPLSAGLSDQSKITDVSLLALEGQPIEPGEHDVNRAHHSRHNYAHIGL